AARNFRQLLARRNLNVNVVDEPRIVRHDVIKVLRMLKRSDNGVARALENADDAALAPMSIFSAAALRNVATDPHYNAVAVHGGASVLGGDENVRLARFFWNEKTEARLMDR